MAARSSTSQTSAPAEVNPPPAALVRLLTAAWIALVGWATLSPAPSTGDWTGEAPLADALRNLLLFAPLGLLLTASGRSWHLASVLAALLSAVVELLQVWIPGRFPDGWDLAANVLGGALGAILLRALRPGCLRAETRSAWIALAAGFGVAGALLLPALLLRPAPPDALYYTEWAPTLERYEIFPGRVLDVRIGGDEVGRSGPSARSRALRRQIREDAPLYLRVMREAPSRGLAPLLRINDGTWEVLLVGVDRDALVVRRHGLAGDLGLEEPLLVYDGAFANLRPAAPVEIHLAPDGVRWRARVGLAGPRTIGPTPASAWRVLAKPNALSDTGRRVVDVLFAALCFGFVAIWLRPRAPAVVGLGIALVSLAVAPAVVGLQPAPPAEWAGAVAGLLAGGLIQRRLLRSEQEPIRGATSASVRAAPER